MLLFEKSVEWQLSVSLLHLSNMGKFCETSAVFNHPWDQLAKAFWCRYPNPYSTHVLSEDTLFREMRGNQLYSRRLLTKTNRLPRWGERFVKTSQVSIVEESYINPANKTIVTYTRNIGFTRIMVGKTDNYELVVICI